MGATVASSRDTVAHSGLEMGSLSQSRNMRGTYPPLPRTSPSVLRTAPDALPTFFTPQYVHALHGIPIRPCTYVLDYRHHVARTEGAGVDEVRHEASQWLLINAKSHSSC